jgi:hypothetical protein
MGISHVNERISMCEEILAAVEAGRYLSDNGSYWWVLDKNGTVLFYSATSWTEKPYVRRHSWHESRGILDGSGYRPHRNEQAIKNLKSIIAQLRSA